MPFGHTNITGSSALPHEQHDNVQDVYLESAWPYRRPLPYGAREAKYAASSLRRSKTRASHGKLCAEPKHFKQQHRSSAVVVAAEAVTIKLIRAAYQPCRQSCGARDWSFGHVMLTTTTTRFHIRFAAAFYPYKVCTCMCRAKHVATTLNSGGRWTKATRLQRLNQNARDQSPIIRNAMWKDQSRFQWRLKQRVFFVLLILRASWTHQR